MAYLNPTEYTQYCGDTAVSDADVAYATGLINAIIGKSLEPNEYTEVVKIKDCKGKLKNTPVVSITEVKGIGVSYNGIAESDLPVNSVYVIDDYGHFMFFAGSGINSMVWGVPSNLKIKYSYGYTVIPDDIKIVCGAIAKNIVKVDSIGGISGAKSITSLDFSIAMFDDRLYSSNEQLILQKYKVV